MEPKCKYGLLFDSRPEFDSFRESFLVSADPHSGINTFVQKLDNLIKDSFEHIERTSPSPLGCMMSLLDKAIIWKNKGAPTQEPLNFAHRVWPVYLNSMQATNYWFSTEEIIVVAVGIGHNVAIFKSIDTELEYHTGYFSGHGPIILIKLASNLTGRVSSHFERIIPSHLVSQLRAAGREEERRRVPDFDVQKEIGH